MVTVALCAVVKKVSHYQNFLKKAVKEELWCTWKFGDLLSCSLFIKPLQTLKYVTTRIIQEKFSS